MTFAEKVIYVRKELKMSQEKLAKELDVSFSTVNRWEKGHVMPSYEMQQRFNDLCKVKGVNIKE